MSKIHKELLRFHEENQQPNFKKWKNNLNKRLTKGYMHITKWHMKKKVPNHMAEGSCKVKQQPETT